MQLAVKSVGSIIIQRALANSIESKCAPSGKVNSHLNGSRTVISIFEENSIETFLWLFCFLAV